MQFFGRFKLWYFWYLFLMNCFPYAVYFSCRLGNVFAELANGYYRDEGRRVKTRLEKKNFSSIELNIRYCFKVSHSLCAY